MDAIAVIENLKKNGRSQAYQAVQTARFKTIKKSTVTNTHPVRNSSYFIRTLTFYSFMQGFFLNTKRTVGGLEMQRNSDFFKACDTIANLAEKLFDSVKGNIDEKKVGKIYNSLKKFQDKHVIDNSYLAVLNFFLLYVVNIVENTKIKNKKTTDMLDSLISTLNFVIEITELEIRDSYLEKALRKIKSKTDKEQALIDSSVDYLTNKHVLRETEKARGILLSFNECFEDVTFMRADDNLTLEDAKRIEGYRKLIRENKNWREMI